MVTIRSVSLAVVLALVCSMAEAAKVHLKGGETPIVTFGVDGDGDNVVVLDAALAGLGEGDVTITALFEGTVVVVVVNPQGHPSPGQQIAVQALGETSIPANEVKNGNTDFTVAAKLPGPVPFPDPNHTTPIEDTLGIELPNDQWHAYAEEVDFPTSITLTITQNGKTTVIVIPSSKFVVLDP